MLAIFLLLLALLLFWAHLRSTADDAEAGEQLERDDAKSEKLERDKEKAETQKVERAEHDKEKAEAQKVERDKEKIDRDAERDETKPSTWTDAAGQRFERVCYPNPMTGKMRCHEVAIAASNAIDLWLKDEAAGRELWTRFRVACLRLAWLFHLRDCLVGDVALALTTALAAMESGGLPASDDTDATSLLRLLPENEAVETLSVSVDASFAATAGKLLECRAELSRRLASTLRGDCGVRRAAAAAEPSQLCAASLPSFFEAPTPRLCRDAFDALCGAALDEAAQGMVKRSKERAEKKPKPAPAPVAPVKAPTSPLDAFLVRFGAEALVGRRTAEIAYSAAARRAGPPRPEVTWRETLRQVRQRLVPRLPQLPDGAVMRSWLEGAGEDREGPAAGLDETVRLLEATRADPHSRQAGPEPLWQALFGDGSDSVSVGRRSTLFLLRHDEKGRRLLASRLAAAGAAAAAADSWHCLDDLADGLQILRGLIALASYLEKLGGV
jgi:hypothetical protein